CRSHWPGRPAARSVRASSRTRSCPSLTERLTMIHLTRRLAGILPIADRDLVFVHAQLSDMPANAFSGLNRDDFCRLDQGRIVEYWSVEVPATSTNGHRRFSALHRGRGPR